MKLSMKKIFLTIGVITLLAGCSTPPSKPPIARGTLKRQDVDADGYLRCAYIMVGNHGGYFISSPPKHIKRCTQYADVNLRTNVVTFIIR